MKLASGSGNCEARDCTKKGVRLPNSSLFSCKCGCEKTMCQTCVIAHNRDVSRALKHWKAAQS